MSGIVSKASEPPEGLAGALAHLRRLGHDPVHFGALGRTGAGVDEIETVAEGGIELRDLGLRERGDVAWRTSARAPGITMLYFLAAPWIVLETDATAKILEKNARMLARYLPIEILPLPPGWRAATSGA